MIVPLVYNLDAEGYCKQCDEAGIFLRVSFGTMVLTVIMVILSAIFITVTVILARDKARALKKIQVTRESTQRENATYEEINLSQLDIGTSKNIAYSHLSSKCVHVPK